MDDDISMMASASTTGESVAARVEDDTSPRHVGETSSVDVIKGDPIDDHLYLRYGDIVILNAEAAGCLLITSRTHTGQQQAHTGTLLSRCLTCQGFADTLLLLSTGDGKEVVHADLIIFFLFLRV